MMFCMMILMFHMKRKIWIMKNLFWQLPYQISQEDCQGEVCQAVQHTAQILGPYHGSQISFGKRRIGRESQCVNTSLLGVIGQEFWPISAIIVPAVGNCPRAAAATTVISRLATTSWACCVDGTTPMGLMISPPF